MKKLCITCLTALLFFAFLSQAQAANLHDYYVDMPKEDLQGSIIMSLGNNKAFVDGEEVSGDQPITESGRTLVPVRFISQALGAKVDWFPESKKVTIALGDQKISLVLGSKDMEINSEKRSIEVPARVYQDRTYLPLRAIGEALGKTVAYDGTHKLIYLRNPEGRAIEDNYYSGFFSVMCSWLFQGREMVYGDHCFGIYRGKDGQLYIADSWVEEGELLSSYHRDEDLRNKAVGWHKTPYGNYFIFDNWGGENSGTDEVYKVEGDKFQWICSAWISDIKFYDNYMYLVTSQRFGPEGRTYESNLKRYNLTDFTGTYLGLVGYVYGHPLSGEKVDWEIKPDGVDIIGYVDLMEGVLASEEDKKASYGKYKVSLTGNSHEKIFDEY